MTAFTTGWSFKAIVEAFRNPDMNPNLILCFFKNYSPYVFLILMYPDISTSLKVVSRAFVFYAFFKFSAILILILVIGTLVSNLYPPIVVGAFLAVVLAAPPPGAAAAGAFCGVTGGGGGGAAALGGSGAAALAGSGVAGAAGSALGAALGGAEPPLASVSRM